MHQAYKNCEGRSTPARDKLGQFLTFNPQIPSTPDVMNQVIETEPYTDINYINLIENVNGINGNYDAGNTQDINLDFFESIANDTPLDIDATMNYPDKMCGKGIAKKNVSLKRKYQDDDAVAAAASTKFFAPEPKEPEPATLRTIIKQKTRGRYIKKMPVATRNKPSSYDPATELLFNDILQDQPDDMQLQNNRMFASHLLDTGYYMFIVTKADNADDPYTIRYINCVHSVYNEYVARHMHHDRFVLVVTYERYRFLISYQLLLDLEIDIPQQDQFSEKKLQSTNKKECHFEEVKDFEFLTLLTNYFHLDKVFAQGKISLLLASIGEYKARLIFNTLAEMVNDKSLFTLPFHMCKKEVSAEELARMDSSAYIDDIIKLTQGLRFKVLPEYHKKHDRTRVVDNVLKALSFWLRSKDIRSSDFKEKNNFTYKFGSVVRVLYDTNDKGVNKLFKIKKENGSVRLIEQYLEACKQHPDSHNFMLITTKSDERITVIKMGTEFIWITSVIKDIIVSDIVKKFRLFSHHIFNLNSVNRKEINNRHNGLVKLIAFYTGQMITLEETKRVAINNFGCNYDVKLHPHLTTNTK